MYRRLLVALLASLILLQPASPAWAWGRVGHRVIGRFAEAHMTPKAKAAVAALLEPGESLADASTWADENRGRLPRTAPWHYVDVPLDEPRYDSRFSGDAASKGCIVDKIHEMTATLKDPSRSVEDRRLALRFLIHLLEDLHMPLHVGDNGDKGGNSTQVRFFGRGSNLHRVWDSGLIERDGTEDAWLSKVAKETTSGDVASGTIEDWATESLLLARAAYRVPGGPDRLRSGQKLGDSYVEQNVPVVRSQLHKAGMRLARVLDEALGQ